MIKAFSEVSRTIQGIKVRPPKPAVSGKLIGKHSSDGFKLGLEKPFEKLPDEQTHVEERQLVSESVGGPAISELSVK